MNNPKTGEVPETYYRVAGFDPLGTIEEVFSAIALVPMRNGKGGRNIEVIVGGKVIGKVRVVQHTTCEEIRKDIENIGEANATTH